MTSGTDSPTPHAEPSPHVDAAPVAGVAPSSAAYPTVTFRGVVRRLGPAGPLAIVAATLPALGAVTIIVFVAQFAPWLQTKGAAGIIAYVAGFALLSGCAILPSQALSIIGGWAFGFAVGLPAAVLGYVGGALIGFIISRHAAGQRVVGLIQENARWAAVHRALLGRGFWSTLGIVTLVRVTSLPFSLTNLVFAATRVPLLIYTLGTLFGMMPRIAIIVWVSSHLSTLDFDQAENRWIVVGGVVVTLIVLSVIGGIGRRAITRVTSSE